MPDTHQEARTESLGMRLTRIPYAILHAFQTFLAVPTLVVAAFLLLAIGTYSFERRGAAWFPALRDFLASHLFAESEATIQVLAAIAGGMITVTSITFSLLLVALQQSAGSMTHAVFDQFLRRRLNQFYAGWFIGMTLYTLVTLATVGPDFNPVLGASISLLLAVTALYVLLLLIYSAIEQMRPAAILEAIHDHTLQARERQLPLLRRTRRHSQQPGPTLATARAPSDGFVTAIDLEMLADALRQTPNAEIGLYLPLGGYAAFHDPLAEVRASSPADAEALAAVVVRAVRLERERDLEHDPAFGLEQIETIAWTTISTSKQDPNPGLEAARNLRDILARWAVTTPGDTKNGDDEPLAVVYPDDVLERLMGTLESLAVVASESMQHQTYAEILRGLATTLDRLPPPLAGRSEEVVRRSLTGLGDHVLTSELEGALEAVAAALEREGMTEGARDIRIAQTRLAMTVGHLHSRGTRVQE